MRRFAILLLVGLVLAACSRPTAPVGRWAGHYESRDVMIDARLEIERGGGVRVSAMDLLNVGQPLDEERAAMHARLAADLARGWNNVRPRRMDFDGKVFRKPGGIAPHIEWNARTRQMTIMVYFGTHPAIRFPLQEVENFDDDPWSMQDDD
jgi:hypothetical protein